MFKKIVMAVVLATPAMSFADVYLTVGAAIGSTDMEAIEETYGSDPVEVEDDVQRAVIGAGIEVNKYLAFEASYLTSVDNEVGSIAAKDELSHQGIQLAALGRAPITEQFSVYAKLTANVLSTEYKYSDISGNYAEGDDSGTYLGFGVGLAYRINDSVGVRLGAERIQIKDVTIADANLDPAPADFDVTQASLMLDFHF